MSFVTRHLRRLTMALMLASASLTAATAPAWAEKVLHRGNGAEPETLDPAKSSGVPDSWIQYDLFEGLLIPDGSDKLIPGAAEKWDISPDGLVYTFHLRRNAKWSDGTPVTAADWVFSWKRLVDPKNGAKYGYFLWVVKNAQAINLGKLPVDQMGVRALDDYTFQVTLERPTPYFLSMLHHHSTYALSKTNVEKFGADFIKPGNLVTNGVYKLAEAVPQSHVKLVKNTYHPDAAKTPIDTVMFYPTENLDAELKRYRAGELHITYEVPVTQMQWLRANMASELRLAPYFGTYFFAANLTKEPWKSNKDLRLALNLAIDRNILVEKINQRGELPAYSFVPPGVAGYTQQVPDYASWTQAQREAKAKELMQKAGYGPGGKPLEIEILYNTHENHRKLAIAVASMWQQKLGVKTTLNNQEWKVFLNTRDEKKFKDVVRHGWIGDYIDAASFLDLARSDIGKQNPSGYSNPAYDKLLDQATAAPTAEQRAELMQQAERLMVDDVAVFPLHFYSSKHMVSPKLIGWKDNLLDSHPSRFLDVKE
ncbi:peptide ABC transporter substrate-binding protein [Niveispirillum sp. BGYR6]|uniref:peptide ABC transporter substrate-binding protein n=1 Tax=Niveispirillum sp. BGYR6 TaxID=2971249 RepID=UPI0022B94F85|nr:peptide ABC transporter substrate-binding protein [Niveispirillum sp. BGYR6]MDG5497109.1 peptide ABC transporter substrate-binding protein [Niveispirillum sp. BGYR6]